MFFRDLGWFLLKDNIIVNTLYYLAFRNIDMIRKLSKKRIENGYWKKHPAYLNHDENTIIDKGFVIKNAEEFSSESGTCFKGFTSGTTNTPLKLYRSLISVIVDELSLRSHWYINGIGISPRIATIRGDNLFPGEYKGDVYWKKTPFSRRLIMSGFHLRADNHKLFLDKLQEEKPDIILAYPSSMLLLAKFALLNNWKPNWNLKGVFTSGESFSSEDQELVRKVFPNLYDYYGQAERVARLQQCKYGHYHVVDWYTHVEFIDHDEEHVKIVGSNLFNKSMPLHRYNTDDLIKKDDICTGLCVCGNPTAYVKKISGRQIKSIILKDGTTISSTHLSIIFWGVNNIREGQYYVRKDGLLDIRYSTLSGIRDIDCEKELLANMAERFGKGNVGGITYFQDIEKEKSGKLSLVKYEVNNKPKLSIV